MKNSIYRKHNKARKILNFIWLLLTILLLLSLLHHEWQDYRLQKKQALRLDANELAAKFDDLLNTVFHSVYSIPIYGHEIEDCQHDLLPILYNLNFNNPAISAVVLSDSQNKVICSTLDPQSALPPPPAQTPVLIGPVAIGWGRVPAFLLQQRLGKYYIGVYMVRSVFDNILSSVTTKDKRISLYDKNQKKNLLTIGNSLLSLDNITLASESAAKTNLQSLANVQVMIVASPTKLNIDFFYQQLPLLLGITLASSLIYFKSRAMINNRYSLHYALSNALKRNLFQPAYQPIQDHSANRFCGAEVLLRWQTDANEIIMPDSFIGDAEKSGLIVPITLQLIEKAFQQIHHFLHHHPHFYLSFNLSANHFSDNDFFIQFFDLCTCYTIPPHQLMLELTERELLDQNDLQLIKQMQDLRIKGYSLAIDDFGTGHASIKYLQHFPFNYIKIDKIFVQAIGTGAVTENLNQAIIHMARCMELNIIAEGVETEEQLHFLLKNKINLMQGWYFAKALSYEELVQSVSDQEDG